METHPARGRTVNADRINAADRIAARLNEHDTIDAWTWNGTEMKTARVYLCEVMPDGVRKLQRGPIEIEWAADGSGDVYAVDHSKGWTGDQAEVIDDVAAGVCWGANLRRRAA
jgi:hypothetical protein